MQTCKPGPVPGFPGFYHLSTVIVAHHLYQPTRSGVAGCNGSGPLPVTGTYLAFQLLRFTARHVAMPGRALLPHVFTLTPILIGAVYFLWHLLSPIRNDAFPLGSRMPCAARTFLPKGKTHRSGRTFCCGEDREFFRQEGLGLRYGVRSNFNFKHNFNIIAQTSHLIPLTLNLLQTNQIQLSYSF